MFGPDICGSTRRVHAIFNHKDTNKLIKKEVRCETDTLTHVYTLIVKPDLTYEIRIDGVKKEGGKLEDDWEFLAPRKIKDPKESKPSDWVDEATIEDPADVKPAGHDDIQKKIPDPEAQKPNDWDDEADGVWDAPQIDNPAYKGPWKAKKIPNPAYKGKWEHPLIDNPEYKEDSSIGQFENNAYVGFELWQVKAGTIFDNIILTDSVEEAEALLKSTYSANIEAEKKAKEAFEKAEADKKHAEEEAKKKTAAPESAPKADDDDDDDDDKPKEKPRDEL